MKKALERLKCAESLVPSPVCMKDTKYTFAQTHLSLRHSTDISCAGLCTVDVTSECCGDAAAATYVQPSVYVSMCQKMLSVRCNTLLNKTFASLPRKERDSDNRVLDVIS